MAKNRKNANYQTEKRERDRLEREVAEKKAKRDKILKWTLIPTAAILFVAGIIALLFSLGVFGYKVTHRVTIVTQNYGNIELELYGEEAPITVASFVNHITNEDYDGATFDQITDGYKAQCNTANESKKAIVGEFSSNGIRNMIKHQRGVISMEKFDDESSTSGRFFILQKDTPELDGEYAAFGRVTSGLENLDKLCRDKEEGKTYSETIYRVFVDHVATHSAEIDIEGYGTVKLDLYGYDAPISVENFVKLARENYYDDTVFHRIIEGFMAQGGAGNGSAKTIKGEFESNGFVNPIKHKRGVISMARTVIKDSANSQFFIMHKDAPHLDGDYAAFGEVTEGIEFIDRLCAGKFEGQTYNVKILDVRVYNK